MCYYLLLTTILWHVYYKPWGRKNWILGRVGNLPEFSHSMKFLESILCLSPGLLTVPTDHSVFCVVRDKVNAYPFLLTNVAVIFIFLLSQYRFLDPLSLLFDCIILYISQCKLPQIFFWKRQGMIFKSNKYIKANIQHVCLLPEWVAT